VNRETVGQLALLLVGICLLVGSPSAERPSGTAIDVEREPLATPPEDASVVEFRDLSSETQDAFRRAFADDDDGAFDDGGGHARLPADGERLAAYDCVRYRGDYYRFHVVAVDNVGSGQVFLVAGLGVGAIVAAGLWRLTGSDEASRDGPRPPEP
jgi:hypothetical protein